MAIRDIFKITRRTFLYPTGWIDFEALKSYNINMWRILRGVFTIPTPGRTETFEQAMHRLRMSEADIKQATINYRRYALMFLGLGLIVFFYSFYLLFRYATITGWLLGIAASAVFASQAFQYDFWAFQLRERQLGLTFQDWKRHLLGEKGPKA